MTKYKRRSRPVNQKSLDDLRQAALKRQGYTSTLTVPSQENLKLVGTGVKPTDGNRLGDLAEHYAVTWLWDNGWEVFKNCGCTGPIDLIGMDSDKNLTFIDVKTLTKANMPSNRTQMQKDLGVQFLLFDADNRSLRFMAHRT